MQFSTKYSYQERVQYNGPDIKDTAVITSVNINHRKVFGKSKTETIVKYGIKLENYNYYVGPVEEKCLSKL